MDINSLLSPENPLPPSSGRLSRGSRQTPVVITSGHPPSGLSNEVLLSPEASVSRPHHGKSEDPQPKEALGSVRQTSGNVTRVRRTYGKTGEQQQTQSNRKSFTPEPCTETASLRPEQRLSRNSPAMRSKGACNSSRSMATITPVRRNGTGQSLADLTMAEAPAQTPPPREFTSNVLSSEESQTVNNLLSHLREKSYDYGSHVELINILHKGFVVHTRAQEATGDEAPEPHSYALLNDLRQAREAMDSRFAVGEALWADWLADEMILVRSSDDRVTVTELCQKAVQDEPTSVRLWMMYLEWIQSNYATCHVVEGADQSGWKEEDRAMCQELFTREMITVVLEQGMTATQWRLDCSHNFWNQYIELMQQSGVAVVKVRDMFVKRMQQPHAAWQETSQMYWSFISRHFPDHWEQMMIMAKTAAEPAQKQITLRSQFESSLRQADESGDASAVFAAFDTYLSWERKYVGRGQFALELCCAQYERALLRFPTYAEWWLDYIDLLTVHGQPVLPVIDRATRHCPWSGDLWSRRILRCEVQKTSHEEIEHTKHRATNSGLLDAGGMEELLKVLQEWCGYLRRHAFRPDSTEYDQDTAEMGILQAREDIQRIGEEVYGRDFQGDPLWRLETIQIKFYTEARRVPLARQIFDDLTKSHRTSATMWLSYFRWELLLWSHERLSDSRRVEQDLSRPRLATEVLRKALKEPELDDPDSILHEYITHFQHNESPEQLQMALADAREFRRRMIVRRTKESEEALRLQVIVADDTEATVSGGKKRKAETDHANDGRRIKAKNEDISPAVEKPANAPEQAPAKRDREHNCVTVHNLPQNVTELVIKKFFRDVGVPRSVHIRQEKDTKSASATVEFESTEQVLAAKTRDRKRIEGHEVRVRAGQRNTLYVANYPAEYDETALKSLFEPYGQIMSVRLPSLKYNSRRRFCYVQFLREEDAQKAEAAMDDKILDGQHRLTAKISNPEAKKARSGAQAEGRELYVRNVDRNAPEDEIKSFFEQYGQVERINMVKLVNNKRIGTGFIVFSTKDEAEAAIAANNKPFRDRILHVEISRPKGQDRARKADIIVQAPSETAGRRVSDVSMASDSKTSNDGDGDEGAQNVRERKVAILNLSDTVNDARIRTALESYGTIRKIQLRRTNGGAIVEFAHAKDAFRVRQGVDVSSLGPETRTGDVGELLGKSGKSVGRGGSGGRGQGRRGGLGTQTRTKQTNENAGPKSNDEFRAMLG
ncbi:hypothetical protein K470DRAFT_294342 [Piedraia hortae CBS 480.64]|uniref:RRM domain-containing protein n=1 Tax=Piedraia hortae CBS 480.64 TaxID=1314780 RepID=A0A6A7C2W9_9PEZI|nr:hypothetical protein K470DRAFT_294342 [Piedraia hortae CBS 480.64]